MIAVDGVYFYSMRKHFDHCESKVDRLRNYSLIDSVVSRGVESENARAWLTYPDHRINIRGTDDHGINSMPIVEVRWVTKTTIDEVVITMHQHNYYSKGHSTHSSGQIDNFKNFVDEKSIKVEGKKFILTNDNHMIRITIKNSFPCMPLRSCSDHELSTSSRAVLTSDVDWDPGCLYSPGGTDNKMWCGTQSPMPQGPSNPSGNKHVEFRGINQQDTHHFYTFEYDYYEEINNLIDTWAEFHITNYNNNYVDENTWSCNSIFRSFSYSPHQKVISFNSAKARKKESNYAKLQPYFEWLHVDDIKKTFETTTQQGRTTASKILKSDCKSPFLDISVHRRYEPVAAITSHCNIPDIDDGLTSALMFVGNNSLITYIHCMKSDK